MVLRNCRFRRMFSTKSSNNILKDFEFKPSFFAKNMNLLLEETPKLGIEEVKKQNEVTLGLLKQKASYEGDPFTLVDKDLEFINSIIFEKIINTNYELLKEVAEYNLRLKGKNFRS